jgi:hypothetical protein
MLEHIFVRKGVIARLRQSPLGLHLDHLATSLHNEGYASLIVQRYLLALRNSLIGYKDKAIPSTRWTRSCCESISLNCHDTVLVTFQKRPEASDTSSDSSNNKVSPVHG